MPLQRGENAHRCSRFISVSCWAAFTAQHSARAGAEELADSLRTDRSKVGLFSWINADAWFGLGHLSM